MARSRNIKPGFFDNEVLGEMPALTRLLFIGLWCLADREGRLYDRPKRIKKELLGYDDVDSGDVDGMLQQLHDKGFIIRYTVGGERFIQVTNFSKHQNPHCKERESTIPAPDKYTHNSIAGLGVAEDDRVKGRRDHDGMEADTAPSRADDVDDDGRKTAILAENSDSTLQAQCKHDTSTVQAGLIPDSLNLIPESLNTPLSPLGDGGTDTHNSIAGLGVAEDDRVKGRRDHDGMEADTAPSRADDVDGDDTENGIGKANKSPDWKTAKTALEIGFCKFWDAYPGYRRTSKLACWRKWRLIKPNEALVQQMLDTLEKFANSPDWKKEGGKYIPAPLVWLNQGRWEDEIVEVKTGGGRQNTGRGGYTAGFRTQDDYQHTGSGGGGL